MTKRIISDICFGIKKGFTVKYACCLAGISESAFYGWMNKGRNRKSGLFVEFVEEVEKAQEHIKSFNLRMVQELAKGYGPVTKTQVRKDADGNVIGTTETTEQGLPSLQALTWLLERRWPEEFGPKRELAITNSDNPFEVGLFGQLLIGSDKGDIAADYD